MTKFIIIVAILQIILSISLVAREKNEIANVSEIISSFILFNYLNAFSFEGTNILWKNIGLTLIEYLGVKVFLVIFMIIARIWSFYEIKALYSKKKKSKAKSKKLKIIRTFSKVKYWPRLKLGLPSMAGKVHPKTKIRFDKKGFPKFKSNYTVKLRAKDFNKTRERHFSIANKLLYENINSNKKLRAKFSSIQISELSKGETPNGYTWHHHQDAGILQLVDSEVHSKTSHIGGFSIWGGSDEKKKPWYVRFYYWIRGESFPKTFECKVLMILAVSITIVTTISYLYILNNALPYEEAHNANFNEFVITKLEEVADIIIEEGVDFAVRDIPEIVQEYKIEYTEKGIEIQYVLDRQKVVNAYLETGKELSHSYDNMNAEMKISISKDFEEISKTHTVPTSYTFEEYQKDKCFTALGLAFLIGLFPTGIGICVIAIIIITMASYWEKKHSKN